MRQLDKVLAGSKAASGPVDVLKIDVEGYELNALKGGMGFLSHVDRRPPMIFSEYSTSMMDVAGSDPEEYLRMLLRLGYEICPITGPYRGTEINQDNAGQIVKYSRSTGNQIWDIVAHQPQAGYAECPKQAA
jgi:hypothetical protein